MTNHEPVIVAVVAMIDRAVPTATVLRNADKPVEIPAGGLIIVRDGEPGEPTIDLSPLTYNYSRRIALEVATLETPIYSREQALAEILSPIGLAIEADPFLGGLCQYLHAEAPTPDDVQTYGAPSARWSLVILVADYATRHPLG